MDGSCTVGSFAYQPQPRLLLLFRNVRMARGAAREQQAHAMTSGCEEQASGAKAQQGHPDVPCHAGATPRQPADSSKALEGRGGR